MDTMSLLIAVPLVLAIIYVAIRLPMAIGSNLRTGHWFRRQLAKDLDQLRLSRMLRYLGIDEARYLHEQKAVDIKNHMRKCDACDAKNECDEVLQVPAPSSEPGLGFCANIDDLKTIQKPSEQQPDTQR